MGQHWLVPESIYRNPDARSWRITRPTGVIEFHRSLPGYAPTRLVALPELAAELGVANVYVKEESARLGLPAFKILGASYAIARALGRRHGITDRVVSRDELTALIAASPPLTLVAATDGNHGRAVAHTARLLGLHARIYTPAAITPEALAAIADEGADVVTLSRPYDDVVQIAAANAAEAGDGALLIQDTAWPGYQEIPQWIVDGYSTLFDEVDAQLADAGQPAPDLVAVPVGVGSLLQAALTHFRSAATAPMVLSVEPTTAPTVLASLRAGEPRTVDTPPTIMTGLSCGTPSSLAWPVIVAGVDLAVTVDDDAAATAVSDLAALGVDAGPCGAATLAGVRVLVADSPLDRSTSVLLLSTESRAANPLPKR